MQQPEALCGMLKMYADAKREGYCYMYHHEGTQLVGNCRDVNG